jgi:hypothetical protein
MRRIGDLEIRERLEALERELSDLAELAMSRRAATALRAVAVMVGRLAAAFRAAGN